jgi:hypothetical protein
LLLTSVISSVCCTYCMTENIILQQCMSVSTFYHRNRWPDLTTFRTPTVMKRI